MKKIFFLLVLAFLNMRCESSGSGSPVDIPNIEIDCTTATCSGAASGGYEVTVNFSIAACSVDQLEFGSVVAGTANVTCVNGVGCSGVVSSWRDNNGSVTTTINSRTYSICGWIDLDPGNKNPNDAFSEESVLVASSTITLTDWGAANYFIRKSISHR